MKTPIFIFSLPRSGSTLLQRVLMSHESISSVAEPWILLPQIYNLKSKGTIASYSSFLSNLALNDFIKNLPNKEEDYEEALRNFMLELYSKQCKNNETYFLDKTPRYYLIIDEIISLFPEAKFIFLTRNPIHVFSSIIETFGDGRLHKLHGNYNDVSFGMGELSKACEKYRDKSIIVKYEEFVEKPQIEIDKILEYLDLDKEQNLLDKFSEQNTKGHMGDPSGVKKYNKISTEGLKKWKQTFNSSFRKGVAIRLLRKIDHVDLQTQGYNKETIIKEIKSLKNKKNHLFIKDLFDYYLSIIWKKFQLNLIIKKRYSWMRDEYLS